MQYVNQSLFDVTSGIIVHQVNCKGVMGAGLAKAIRAKWPVVYESYRKHYTKLRPGMVQFVKVSSPGNPLLIVCNLAGQDGYGTKVRQTDYDAIAQALPKLQTKATELSLPIYFPFNMGCGLAGGDWAVVEALIQEHCPDAIICKL